jgi:glycosyltransferase involved in cell wall biosynthesis
MPGRLLLIAYYFPPLGGAGTQRPLKFAKYLPEFGWVPQVVTVADDPTYVHDETLLHEVPAAASVERVNVPWNLDSVVAYVLNCGPLWRVPGMWRLLEKLPPFFVPDTKVTWINPCYRRALRILRRQPVDAILTTSAPYSNHLIGYALKKHTGLPWVADFRDEWAKYSYETRPTPLHRWLDEKLERLVVRQADHVIAVSDEIREQLRNGEPDRAKFSTITNGFDPSDLAAARLRASPRQDGCFRLVYTGTFYGPRSPTQFVKALEALLQRGDIKPPEIRVRLIGRVGEQRLSRPEWQQVLECPGYVEHWESLAELQLADCLLLFEPSGAGTIRLPGKIFEYVASGRPILALVPPDGVAAKVIRESRTGVIVPPDDVQAIEAALLTFLQEWKTGRLVVQPDAQVIQRFERRQLTRRLAAILDEVTSVKRPTRDVARRTAPLRKTAS